MAELIGGAAAVLTINSVDLSDHMTSASLEQNFDDVETTAFGDAVRTRIAGLGDATLNGLVGSTTAFVFKATGASVSATNPSYAGTVVVTAYTPMSAEVGTLSTLSVSWPVTGAITRATS